MRHHRTIRSLVLATILLLALGAGCGVNETDAPGSTAGTGGAGGANACDEKTCSGHGLCTLADGRPICVCDPGFHAVGLSCEKNSSTDACGGVDCGPGGSCDEVDGSPVCACGTGYHRAGATTCLPDESDAGAVGGTGAGGPGGSSSGAAGSAGTGGAGTGGAAGLIENTVDQAWSDSHGDNIIFPATGNSDAGWFQHASGRIVQDQTSAYELVVWTEIESATTGPISCGPDDSKSTNTAVEMGHLRAYILKDGTWTQIFNVKNHSGSTYPKTENDWERSMCDLAGIIDANPGYQVLLGPGPEGFDYYMPYAGYRYHGWGGSRWVPGTSLAVAADAVFVTCYVRLALIDPNGVDDRDLSKFIVHLGADKWVDSSTNLYDLEISRYKQVTNDWRAVSALTGDLTYEQFATNPPPFPTEP